MQQIAFVVIIFAILFALKFTSKGERRWAEMPNAKPSKPVMVCRYCGLYQSEIKPGEPCATSDAFHCYVEDDFDPETA